MKFKIKADFKEFVAVFLNYKLFKAINGKISPMQYHSIQGCIFFRKVVNSAPMPWRVDFLIL